VAGVNTTEKDKKKKQRGGGGGKETPQGREANQFRPSGEGGQRKNGGTHYYRNGSLMLGRGTEDW